MRVMMKVSFPVKSGNKGVSKGSLPGTTMAFVEQFNPEACYFISEGGQRTALFFFDLADSTDIPTAAEPFFQNLNASIELTPAMDLADMKAGVEKAMAKG